MFSDLNRFSNKLEDVLISLVRDGKIGENELRDKLSKVKIVSWVKSDTMSEVDVAVREKVEQAKILRGNGNLKEAVESWLQLLSWSEHSYGKAHESVSICLSKIAYLYSVQAFYSKAEAYYERLIELVEVVVEF